MTTSKTEFQEKIQKYLELFKREVTYKDLIQCYEKAFATTNVPDKLTEEIIWLTNDEAENEDLDSVNFFMLLEDDWTDIYIPLQFLLEVVNSQLQDDGLQVITQGIPATKNCIFFKFKEPNNHEKLKRRP